MSNLQWAIAFGIVIIIFGAIAYWKPFNKKLK